MTFITQPDFVKQVTAMRLTPNKKYLVVCEQHVKDPSCFISVYDLKNAEAPRMLKPHMNVTEMAKDMGVSSQAQSANTGLLGGQPRDTVASGGAGMTSGAASNAAATMRSLPEARPKMITNFGFSSQGSSKYIVLVMCDDTDSKVVILDWQNARVEAAMEFPKQVIDRVSFNPSEDTVVCTSGPNHWKVWRIADNVLKQMPPLGKVSQNRVYTEHCWLDKNKLIGCTIEGEMFYVEDYQLKKEIENAFNSDDNISYVVSIKPFSKGFFIGSNEGDMAMWVRQEENNSTSGKSPYDFIRRWQPPATKRLQILGMAMSTGEEFLAVALSNNNIGMVHYKSIGLNEDLNKEIKFELICKGFHSGSISGLDVAIQRPIIVTCSRDDSTIRLWNYLTGQCELAREYFVLEDSAVRAQAKPLITVAMHPSGYQLAASFIDKIQIHHILHDELRLIKSIDLRNASLIRYSKGGQYFFAVEKTTIYVYNAYTFVELQKLPVDATNGKVLGLVFADQDKAFAVVSSCGLIGRYSLPKFVKLGESRADAKRGDTWTSFRAIDFIKD